MKLKRLLLVFIMIIVFFSFISYSEEIQDVENSNSNEMNTKVNYKFIQYPQNDIIISNKLNQCLDNNNGLYSVPFFYSLNDIYNFLYNVDPKFSFLDFYSYSNNKVYGTELINPGNEVCLPESDLIYSLDKNDTLWNIWNRYSFYGTTFYDFVYYNRVKATGVEEMIINPYKLNHDYKDKMSSFFQIHLSDKKTVDERRIIFYSNEELINKIDEISNDKKIFDMTNSLKNIEVESSATFIVVSSEVFDKSSMSLASISAYAFEKYHKTISYESVSIAILSNKSIAITYPKYNIYDRDDKDFFDNLIKKAEEKLKESDESAIKFIDSILKDKKKKEIYNGVMNGNPSPYNSFLSLQDRDYIVPLEIEDSIIYLYPACSNDFNNLLGFLEGLKKKIEKNVKEVIILSDSRKCIGKEEVLENIKRLDKKSIVLFFDIDENYKINNLDNDNTEKISGRIIQFSSTKGGMLSYFLNDRLTKNNNQNNNVVYFDKIIYSPFSLSSSIEQVSLEIYLKKEDISLGFFDKILSLFSTTDSDLISESIVDFINWNKYDFNGRIENYEFNGNSIHNKIYGNTKNILIINVAKAIIFSGSKGVLVYESPAGCRGIFSLCSSTAKKYPSNSPLCTENCLFDNRYNLNHSISAGIEYLVFLFDYYKDQPNTRDLVIISFFGGTKLVDDIIRNGPLMFDEILDRIDGEYLLSIYCGDSSCVDFPYDSKENRDKVVNNLKKQIRVVYNYINN
jgi:hypothetical protein